MQLPPISAVPPWADLVFHVLAHVPGSTPASLHSPAYIDFCRDVLGPADTRALGADLETLVPLARDPRRYAALQGLAWLFRTAEQAQQLVDRTLGELAAADVADPQLLAVLQTEGPSAEVLRAAVELEAESHRRLPPQTWDAKSLAEELVGVAPAAPGLARCELALSRALTHHGRLAGRRVWVGGPEFPGGPSYEFVAWQAAHEATLHELQGRFAPPPGGSDRPIEHAAVVLLSSRAARAGLGDAHRRFVAHFAEAGLTLSSLDAVWGARVRSLLGAGERSGT